MKFFFSDFDGTLCFANKAKHENFKKEDLEAIETFRSAGHKFGLCTGRPLLGIQTYCKDIIDFDFYILTSGAIILDNDKNVLYEKLMNHDTMKAIAEEFSAFGDVWVHAHHGLYSLKTRKIKRSNQTLVDSFEEVPHDLLHGVSFECSSEEEARNTCIYINQKYPDAHAFQNKRFVDVAAKGVSKGATLKVYRDMISCDKTYGIGDSYNDLPLLTNVDVSFTFHSSPKEIQDVCTHIVDSIAEAIDIILSEEKSRG